jgi:hypothetical protein
MLEEGTLQDSGADNWKRAQEAEWNIGTNLFITDPLLVYGQRWPTTTKADY